MINILPELLQNDSEKKIICDYDDLSPIEYSEHSVLSDHDRRVTEDDRSK